MAMEKLNISMQKNETRPSCLSKYTKTNREWTRDLNVKTYYYEILDENRQILQGINLGKDFWIRLQKHRQEKQKQTKVITSN